MRIDAHQHFWDYDPEAYGWIDERMTAIRRDFRPPELEPLLRSCGFEGSVAVQARQSLSETEYLLGLADRYPSIRGVVGWVDLCSSEAASQLERFRAHPRFVGVRHIVQDEPDDRFLLREDFLRGVALLEPLGLSYDILIYPKQLAAAIEFVERFPRHRLVVDHIAKPHIARRELEPWASSMRALARHENLYCKLSGMVTEADWASFDPEVFKPYLDVVFDAFGPRRLMIGSDWPVCTLAASYRDVMDVVLGYLESFSPNDRAAVLGETATAFYRLEAPTHAS